MTLHPKKIEALHGALRRAFADVHIRGGNQPMRYSMNGFAVADRLVGHGKDKNVLSGWVDDDLPISELAYAWLCRHMPGPQRALDVDVLRLEALHGFDDLDAVTQDFMSEMERLPYRYTLTFPIPDGLLAESLIPNETISPTTTMVRSHTDWASKYPFTVGSVEGDRQWLGYSGLLDFGRIKEWAGDFVQIKDEGYVGPLAITNPIKRALDKFKALMGFALAGGMLRAARIFKPPIYRSSYVVHEFTSDMGWLPVKRGTFPAAMAGLMEEVSVIRTDSPTFDERRVQWFRRMAAVFSDETANQRITTAAQWYFDAQAGMRDNSLLAFVQMMVVLEIIYGDAAANEKVGLGELLRNRCAYAIGKSTADREMIRDQFSEIYSVRSKIVHTGKNQLNKNEQALFDTLSDYCRRSIHNEISLLQKDYDIKRRLLIRDGLG